MKKILNFALYICIVLMSLMGILALQIIVTYIANSWVATIIIMILALSFIVWFVLNEIELHADNK